MCKRTPHPLSLQNSYYPLGWRIFNVKRLYEVQQSLEALLQHCLRHGVAHAGQIAKAESICLQNVKRYEKCGSIINVSAEREFMSTITDAATNASRVQPPGRILLL
jgi:hypothetical protein